MFLPFVADGVTLHCKTIMAVAVIIIAPRQTAPQAAEPLHHRQLTRLPSTQAPKLI